MRKVDYIIAGQGIAGTLISYELWKSGSSFLVIDKPGITNASHVAGAVINPVNINTWAPVANSELFVPAALSSYRDMESITGQSFLQQKPLYVFSQGKNQKTSGAGGLPSLLTQEEIREIERYFHTATLCRKLSPVWQISTGVLLNTWRRLLQENGRLQEGWLYSDNMELTGDGIVYEDIQAKKIIFCEGAAIRNTPLFTGLPFTPNRGEALLLHIPELSPSCIYHHGVRLIPVDNNGLFWCGSNYTWNFTNLQPDETWRKKTETFLSSWLRIPFTVRDHMVAERPTTAGQEPMVGRHPRQPRVFVFNGLGTKGFSMAPYLAKQLCDQLVTPSFTGEINLAKPLHTWIKA
ncbi:MAG: FAD-binding oxidoreductase [Chitinophagaceae bacterium]|nr:FAD-binding oxidoreductase [Chitinophagaceae bacterium]MCW5929788.1 FAD-binding oxidoreductase [Chitinophagaceae bacterium]